MKRVVVDHYGGPEVLTVIDDEVPRPGPGEVGVRVLAAGVSYTDALLRAGSYLASRSRRSPPATSSSGSSRSSAPAVRGCASEIVLAR